MSLFCEGPVWANVQPQKDNLLKNNTWLNYGHGVAI